MRSLDSTCLLPVRLMCNCLDIAHGKPSTTDYGDNPGSIYFNHHGFHALGNQFDCAEVNLPRPNEDRDDQVQLLSAMGIRELSPRVCLSTSSLLPRSTRYHLWMLSMNKAAIAKCSDIVKKTRRGIDCFKDATFTDEYAHELLADVVASRLKAYPTTEKQDLKLVSPKNFLFDICIL